MALNFLEWFALIEKKCKLGRGKRLQSQEITESVSHNLLPQDLQVQTLKPGRFGSFNNSLPLLFYPVHKNYALLIVNFAQPHFDDLGIARLHDPPGELRFDWHFAMAAIDQHTQ